MGKAQLLDELRGLLYELGQISTFEDVCMRNRQYSDGIDLAIEKLKVIIARNDGQV